MSDEKRGGERRKSPRVKFRAHAAATASLDTYSAELLDLSLQGALFAILDEHSLEQGESIILNIQLDSQQKIKMQGKVVHLKEHLIGLQCQTLDNETRALIETVIAQGLDNNGTVRIDELIASLQH